MLAACAAIFLQRQSNVNVFGNQLNGELTYVKGIVNTISGNRKRSVQAKQNIAKNR